MSDDLPTLAAARMWMRDDVAEDGSALLKLEFVDQRGEAFAHFMMDYAAVEATCISLANWCARQTPEQNAPTTTRKQ